VFQSSSSCRKRSPVGFHWVEAASDSASATTDGSTASAATDAGAHGPALAPSSFLSSSRVFIALGTDPTAAAQGDEAAPAKLAEIDARTAAEAEGTSTPR
ncbi:MAG: hypothetical protein WCP82_11960, partial [Alphaproteobacteria bacterium]